MFYLCDNERKESVNRLINLIIYSKRTYDEKVELKKDLKKISSIRCQNHIEPLYSIAIEKKNRRGRGRRGRRGRRRK